MLPAADKEFLERIRARTVDQLRSALGGARNVALLDVPNQRNVGDALIWAGQIAYLRQLGVSVRYVADLHFFDPRRLRRAMPEGVVLINGGGNIGDVWPGHQEYREAVVQALHDYRIVQLPQSVYFQSQARAAVANRIMGAHPDFLMLLRDPPSQERAAHDLPHVRQSFCYDMALGCRDIDGRGRGNGGHDLLVLGRQDRERRYDLELIARSAGAAVETRVRDWQPTGATGVVWSAARAAARFSGRVERKLGSRAPTAPVNAAVHMSLQLVNRSSAAGGVAVYRDARLALVDRLHAHVLAGLLGVEHVVMDNSYGKVRAIYDAYTHGFSTARFASDEDEARAMLSAMVEAAEC